ncbi:hypothetical protein [Caulobacter sp.]
MRDKPSRRSPQRVAAINMILVDVALWLLLGVAAVLVVRLIG